jgi:hypothetical protein
MGMGYFGLCNINTGLVCRKTGVMKKGIYVMNLFFRKNVAFIKQNMAAFPCYKTWEITFSGF